jgi:putative ABC transport system permease protein
MAHVRAWLTRLGDLFARRRADIDLADELNGHLNAHIEDNIRAGMSSEAARHEALIRFGGVTQAAEAYRDQRRLPFVETTIQDLRYALRMLRKSPGFATAAIVTLALGIGANTAIFSLVRAVLLRPLPFPEPDRLAVLWDDMRPRGGPSDVNPAPADYVIWKSGSRSFTDIAALTPTTYNLTGSGEPQKLSGIRTTANLFTVLGMQALLGRTLTAADDLPDATPTAVLGEGLWRSRFGADPGIVGRTINLNGLTYTVVGVVPPDFQFPDKNTAALWVAAQFTPAELALNSTYFLFVVGRLRPHVGRAAAQAELAAIARPFDRSPRSTDRIGVSVRALHDSITRGVRPAMAMLLGAVGLVLMIACVNVANLLLARSASRRREIALRRALGASGARIIRQLLTESALLAAAGAALGVALASLTFTYLTRLVPNGLPSGTRPVLDVGVLLFTAGMASAIVVAFGAGPAFAAWRVSLNAVLKSANPHGTPSASASRLRDGLATAEVMLTVVLLIAAGLLLRSYANVLRAPMGFNPERLLIVETVLSPSAYKSPGARSAFYEGVLQRVRTLPSVSGAGYVNYPPLTFKGGRAYFTVEGEPPPPPEESSRNIAVDRVITDGYLLTLGVPLVRGRHLDERDRDGAPFTVVVNERFATTHWPDRDAVGRRIRFGTGDRAPWLSVVGVVGNVRQMAPDVPVEPEVYIPAGQVAVDATFFWPQHLVVRSSGNTAGLAAAIRRAVADVDPNEPVSNIRWMNDVFDSELLNRNTQMTLVAVFAGLALLMASIGLYGVLSYAVAQRVPEIGVRMALGAEPRGVAGMIVRHGGVVALVGIVLGLATALAGSRLIESLLYGVSSHDPVVFASAAVALLGVALLACWLPARRAAAVDPLVALRAE